MGEPCMPCYTRRPWQRILSGLSGPTRCQQGQAGLAKKVSNEAPDGSRSFSQSSDSGTEILPTCYAGGNGGHTELIELTQGAQVQAVKCDAPARESTAAPERNSSRASLFEGHMASMPVALLREAATRALD